MATEISIYVAASSDDRYFYWDGSAWKAASLLDATQRVGYLTSSYWKYGGGMRFLNVTIPKGAIINTAYLTFVSDTNSAVTAVNSRITGEDVDNAATWSTVANYQARRGTVVGGANDNYITAAQVDWDNIEEWVTGHSYNSPSIVSIIQEIVNRAGWVSGNALALFWDDHDDRSTHTNTCIRLAASWDSAEYNPPLLYVKYTLPAAGSRGFIIE